MTSNALPSIGVVAQDRLPLVRLGLTSVIEEDGRALVLGDCASGPDLVALCATWLPEVVVCELAAPDVAETIEACRVARPRVRVAALHLGRASDHAGHAAELGVALISYAASPEAVRAAIHGDCTAGGRRATGDRRAAHAQPLSDVQRRLLDLVARGVDAPAAAAQLGVDRAEATRAVAAAQRTLGASSLDDVVRRARRAGVLADHRAAAPRCTGATWTVRARRVGR